MLTFLIFWVPIMVVVAVIYIHAHVMKIKYDKLIDAVFRVHIHAVSTGESIFDTGVDYSDILPNYKLVFKIWKWKYTDLLDESKFEIIKRYMRY